MSTSEDDQGVGDDATRPAAAKPLDVDGVRTVLVGTVLWAVAFVVLLVLRDELVDQGREWWLWTALAGAGLGMLGFEYTRRRRDAIVRVRRYRSGHPEPTAEPEPRSSTQNGRSASDS